MLHGSFNFNTLFSYATYCIMKSKHFIYNRQFLLISKISNTSLACAILHLIIIYIYIAVDCVFQKRFIIAILTMHSSLVIHLALDCICRKLVSTYLDLNHAG